MDPTPFRRVHGFRVYGRGRRPEPAGEWFARMARKARIADGGCRSLPAAPRRVGARGDGGVRRRARLCSALRQVRRCFTELATKAEHESRLFWKGAESRAPNLASVGWQRVACFGAANIFASKRAEANRSRAQPTSTFSRCPGAKSRCEVTEPEVAAGGFAPKAHLAGGCSMKGGSFDG